MKVVHNPYYQFFLTALISILSSSNLCAQGTSSIRLDQMNFKHHLVLALDRSGSVKTKVNKADIETLISVELPELLMQQHEALENRAFLQEDDYLSIVSFGFNKRRPNVNDFIQIIDEDFSVPFGYTFKTDINPSDFQNLWNQINQNYNTFFRKHWTGLSFVGPMALNFLNLQNTPAIHRTFVLVLTDGEFNTIEDPNNEINMIANETIGDSLQNRRKVFSIYNQVRKFYFWEKIIEHQVGDYKMIIYEYTPTLSAFAIESLCTFNQDQVLLNRKPDGFEASIPLHIYDNDYFQLNKIDLEIINQHDEVIQVDSFSTFQKDNKINIRLNRQDYQDIYEADQVSLRFWVDYKDQVYNAHELHPYGNTLQGAKGLHRSIPIKYEVTKKIFGIVPMSNGLYRFSSMIAGDHQQSNIHFWNILIACVLMVLFGGLFFRYVIKNRKDHQLKDVIIKTNAN